PGDMLFVDSSHMIRPGGDVLFEFLELIPRLRSGVVVQVHDVFTPSYYPRDWMFEKVMLWNEQYLLEALLAHNQRYEVIAALAHLKNVQFDALKRVCPYLAEDSEPGAFYFRVR
ncbi:MAG: class I SAM-dependent methyltransferase, partial [Planctomycetota bacterium]